MSIAERPVKLHSTHHDISTGKGISFHFNGCPMFDEIRLGGLPLCGIQSAFVVFDDPWGEVRFGMISLPMVNDDQAGSVPSNDERGQYRFPPSSRLPADVDNSRLSQNERVVIRGAMVGEGIITRLDVRSIAGSSDRDALAKARHLMHKGI